MNDATVSFNPSISDVDYTKRIQWIMLIRRLKTLSRDSSNLVPRRRSNVNSFDKVSFSSLLPRTNAERNRITRPSRVVNPNLHLYRLHAINENIKSIFAGERERKRLAHAIRAATSDALLRRSAKKINRDATRRERLSCVSSSVISQIIYIYYSFHYRWLSALSAIFLERESVNLCINLQLICQLFKIFLNR